MTLNEFNKLEYNDKLLTIVDSGVFVDNYVTKEIRLNCYSLYKFFVELIYNSEKNKISEIRAFAEGEELDKYSFKNFKII